MKDKEFSDTKKYCWMRVITGFRKSPQMTMSDLNGRWCDFYTHDLMAPIETVLQPTGYSPDHYIQRNKLKPGEVVIARLGAAFYLMRASKDGFMILDQLPAGDGHSSNYVPMWRETLVDLLTTIRIELTNPRQPVSLVRSTYKACGVWYSKTKKLTVMSGSEVSKKIKTSKFRWYPTDVKKLLNSGILINHPTNTERWVLRKDFTFSSKSSAATIITGSSANGKDYWG